MKQVNFVGIGAQKCATTWLQFDLKFHKNAFISQEKELNFFSNYYDRGYAWFDQHFLDGQDAAVRGEISPSYFYNPAVPERVRAYNPEIRLVAILRDPVDRAFSNHLHEIKQKHLAPLEFEGGDGGNNPAYLEQSRYGEHLTRWRREFGPDQLKIMLYEEIRQDPQAAVAEVCTFLDLDPAGVSGYAQDHQANVSLTYRMETVGNVLHAGAQQMRRLGLGKMAYGLKEWWPLKPLLEANRTDLRAVVPPMKEMRHAPLWRRCSRPTWRLRRPSWGGPRSRGGRGSSPRKQRVVGAPSRSSAQRRNPSCAEFRL